MLFTLGITALWTLLRMSHSSHIPIVAFALTGYSTVLVWRNMPNRLNKAIEIHLGLMHHRNVRPIDIYIARVLLEVGALQRRLLFFLLCFALSGGWILRKISWK